MKKYCGKMDGSEVPEQVLDLADRTAAKYEVVEKIVDIDDNEDGIWFQLQREGLPEQRDYTWSALSDIYQHIPGMVKEFLQGSTKKVLDETAARHL